jgi:hypothetical protein
MTCQYLQIVALSIPYLILARYPEHLATNRAYTMTTTAGPSSGPAVHIGPSSGQDGPTKRLRTGCHTCRIRKKVCRQDRRGIPLIR